MAAGAGRTELVHRLVLEAFAGPCPPGRPCRHLDGDRRDNRADNLAWGTPRENATDTAVHGRVRGQRLTEARARELLKRLAAGGRPDDLAREFGMAEKTVRNLAAGGTWARLVGESVPHGGFRLGSYSGAFSSSRRPPGGVT